MLLVNFSVFGQSDGRSEDKIYPKKQKEKKKRTNVEHFRSIHTCGQKATPYNEIVLDLRPQWRVETCVSKQCSHSVSHERDPRFYNPFSLQSLSESPIDFALPEVLWEGHQWQSCDPGDMAGIVREPVATKMLQLS